MDLKEQRLEEESEDNIIVEIDKISSFEKGANDFIDQEDVLKLIKKLIGVPYRYSGKDPSGFDCSGFTSYIYKNSLKSNISPASSEQYRIGQKVAAKELLFGDLVFFNTTGRIPSHVGFYIGNNSFAHASSLKGVTISSLSSEYYKKRYLGARRVLVKKHD